MNAEATLLDRPRVATDAARILVVEDERIVARSLRRQLTSLGYAVVAAVPSGEQAIHCCETLFPDLVLMDIHLEGGMDGVQAAAAIRRLCHLPVVYLTAYSNQEILQRAKLTEPFGYILKPYEDRELHVVIETALYKHRMEKRQAEREQWFVSTLKCISDGVVATDAEGTITYMNPLAEALTGWTSDDAIGLPFKQVVQIFGEDKKIAISGAPEPTPQGAANKSSLLITKDGAEKSVEYTVSLIRDSHGDVLGRAAVFLDVTWRNRFEEQRRQTVHLEAIGRLAGGVAHSLNNLMTIVVGHCGIMLNDMKPGNPYFVSVQEINRSAARTAALTQKLLAFGRKQLLSASRLDLNQVVSGLASAIRLMQAGVSLRLKAAGDDCPIFADKNQLEESILILVRNACQAMPDGGEVTIKTKNVQLEQHSTYLHPEVAPGPYVEMTVSDTGKGLAEESLQNLFEPFAAQGSGLDGGLALASMYGFVKQCGGDVDARSELGKGTTIRLFLPRV